MATEDQGRKLLPTTIIACSHCDASVQAHVLSERVHEPSEEWEAYKYMFLTCTHCGTELVGRSEYTEDDEGARGWDNPVRCWPEPKNDLDANIHRSVRKDLQEADRCFVASAYSACAVMCGRAVESLCNEKVGSKTLAEGLKKLRANKVIDEKLFQSGEALRHERNIGAHAGEVTTTWQDARDVLDFALAISEYVYVLDEKYKAYLVRKPKKDPSPSTPPAIK